MKRTLLIISIMVLSMNSLSAGPVDQQLAQQLGQRFLGKQLNIAHTAATRDAVDYYAFNAENGGFVIIAGDDRVKPVLAYSTTGSFDAGNLADGFEFMLNSFCHEIQYIRDHNLEATSDIVAEWESVSKSGIINQGRGNHAVVGPLLQTTWHQNFPYNSQCPEDPEGNGGHVYAGCVATAMGQVMKFWNWPEHGTGSHSYYPDDYPQQTANFEETEYHFELMPNDLDSLSTEEDYFYIAQFLHHCGIAVDMMYGPNGSGAYSGDVPNALSNYFGFTSVEYETLGYWGWNFYTNEQWAQMLKDGGLDEGMPLYYSASDDNGAGGHAFVCDGYDENDYFHFNWGWSGKDDAWCPIGALNTTKYAFNDNNCFIGHIQPATPEYYQRPENIADFEVVENEDMTSVTINWTAPEHNLNGEPLASPLDIYVYRNGQEIYQTQVAGKGQRMDFVDENLEEGLYQYSIIAENEYGISRKEYATILVGEKTDVTFVLHDDGGDGWKGACISVTAENGQRIAKITLEEGSDQTIIMPLLSQNLDFIWNHGWYHTSEQYDTDYECSFSIYDCKGNELYTSGEHSDGVFFSFENICDDDLEEVSAVNTANIYPNPTDGILNVGGNGSMTISVMNVLGQKILEMSATDNATVDLSGFGGGIYMIRIETANGTMTKKVSVKR